jgi:hypothetical protein
MKRKTVILAAACLALLVVAGSARAACVNKYVLRTEGNNKKIFTLLTGKITFPEAQEMAKRLIDKSMQPVEWVDEGGKTIARASIFEPVRPMPVACDDKPSGAVINVTFLTFATPGKGITLKFPGDLLVYFDEQTK